jgi:hypothetical protein
MALDNKPPSARDSAMASAHLSERREARYKISFGIEVHGIDPNGHPFVEKTSTIDVSEWGCAFLSSVKMREDAVISLNVVSTQDGRVFQGQEQAFFQVVRVEARNERWFIGAWKIEGKDLWCTNLDDITDPEGGVIESRREKLAADHTFD